MGLPPIPPGFELDSGTPRNRSRGGAYGSYTSPAYDDLEAKLEAEYKLPSGLMASIRTRGERSNADQVSSAGAQSVYQVIPSTRDAFKRKYGVDAYGEPEQAARVAALHLKESIDRGADPVREYIGGPDRSKWGSQTEAYAARVGSAEAPPIPPGFVVDNSPAKPAPAKPSTLGGLIGTADAATLPSGMFAAGRPRPGVHDGDTFNLPDGRNARLSGLDAWELGQQGRKPDGSLAPLGVDARTALTDIRTGKPSVNFTGEQTYGRPVVSLSASGKDQGVGLIRSGNALAAPEYLQGDPRFLDYMEAERLARQNLLGGHGTNAETPGQYRHKDGPWQGAEPGQFGKGGIAVFNDERTPFQGLRPEVEQGYLATAMKPGVTAAELMAYAKDNGFQIRKEDADRFIRLRSQPNAQVTAKVFYEDAPKPVTNPGDGAFGAALRGFGDPINLLDEAGGVVDALGGTNGRENVWNSHRRVADIVGNNIDQNRSILAHDDEQHPIARIGGQLISGVLLPVGGGARTAFQLGRVGAVEGGLAGFGAGEGNPFERLPNAAAGTALGAAGGYALGRVAEDVGRGFNALARKRTGMFAADSTLARDVGLEAAPILNSGAQNVGPTPAARSQPAGGALPPLPPSRLPPGRAAMADEAASPTLAGPPANDLPPIPPGFELDAPFGVTRPMGSPLSAPEIARLAESVDPSSVIARPSSEVSSIDDFLTGNPGRFRLTPEPDPYQMLETRFAQSGRGGTVRMKGPLDVTQRLRTYGGITDAGGELRHSGIGNQARKMDWGSSEGFLGRLVNNEDGLSFEDAAQRLHEEGYFDHVPDRDELLDVLRAEQFGNRTFRREDLNEATAFDDAVGEQNFLRSAAQRGSPYADDVSQEITLDDVDAMRPPAEAYGDAPRLTGRVGNINLDRLENPGDVSQLIHQIGQRVGGFDPAMRGKITQEETRKLAQEIGLNPEDLLKRRQGQALNAEQLYATRVLAQKSREVVAELAQKAVNSGGDEELLAFRKAWVRHVAIEEQVAGATREAGRALQQFRMLARSGDARGAAVKAYLKGAGGKESIEDAAQKIVDLMEDPAKASHFMRQGLQPQWKDKLNELWVNSLLSGPKTHVVNFVGNALTTLYSLPEQGLTAGIGMITRSADRSLGGEVGARVSGLANSAVEGLRAAKQAFKTGEPLDAVSKVETNNYRAISGTKGEIIRLPTRALTAADEFWKTINRNAELHALAYRRAAGETKTAAERKARYEQLIATPDAGMTKAADDAARYYTFQRELGPSGKSIQQWVNNTPGAKLFVPFVRTPINLLKFAGERSVLGPVMMPSVRQALRSGGRARDEALAKITLGSGLSTAAVLAAMDGKVTGGGPADPHERMALLQSGWQPYSIKVGDRYISYQRFDPLSTLFGAAADFAEIGRYARPEEADKFAMSLGLAVAKNITSKTWLSGLSDAFDVLSDPQRYGEGYVKKMAGALVVPAISAQTAQALDPNIRETQSILDAIRARVPVLSQGLPVRRNVWGEEVMRGDSVGPDLLSPIYGTRVDRSPVAQEVARLRVPLSMPKRQVTVSGQRIDLDAEQYDTLVQLSGKPARTYLESYIKSPEYLELSDLDRVEAIREVMKDFRASGVDALKGMYPELGGNLARGDVPPVPEGFSVEGESPPPARRSASQINRPLPAMPPLPPGFVLDPVR